MSGGTTYFHINYRGDLEPCVFMHFATDNIVDLYQRGGHLWDVLDTPFFKAIRERNRCDRARSSITTSCWGRPSGWLAPGRPTSALRT